MTGSPSRATAQGEPGLLTGGDVAVEGDRVAVDLRCTGVGRRCGGLVVAADREVVAERDRLGAARLEVGEHPPLAGCQVERGRPGAVLGPLRVDVLETGEVTAYGDQVELLLVLLVVLGDWVPAASSIVNDTGTAAPGATTVWSSRNE